MDMNGNNGQINNQQITPQMMAQVLNQMMQQNNPVPQVPPTMNWNIPTNPMAAMWMNNMMNMMNNQNQNVNQPQNNQNNQPVQQPQQTDNMDPAVRIVKSPEEIKADEIPMNGSIRLFLQEDMKVIHGKRWTNNGVIENIRFIREEDSSSKEAITEMTPQTNIDYDSLFKGISDMMDQKLDQFRKEYIGESKSTRKQSSKKEVNEYGE